jgi:phosphate/sulfate permease
MDDADPTFERLEDQIGWYDRKSNRNQKVYKWIKVVEIGAAAFIPFAAGLKLRPEVAGGLGVLVTVLEGLLHLNQYQHNWITYRSTCESLKHEKYLYLAKAGPYAAAASPHALLAERIESLVSQEHAKWAAGQEQTAKIKKG